MPTFNVHDSAGVFDYVIDESQFTISSSETKIGIIGVANKGPIGVPTLVRSQKNFIDIFDAPSTQGFGGLAATNALGETNQVIFTRIATDAAEKATVTLVSPATSASIIGSEFARFSFGFGQLNNDFLVSLNGKQTQSVGFDEGVYPTTDIVTILDALFTGDANVAQTNTGYITITSVLEGTNSIIKILSTAAATTLGFAPGTYTGTNATSAYLSSPNGGVWLANTFDSADALVVKFNNDPNLLVNLTGSFIDGIDNVVDLVDAFNNFAVNNVDASLANTAVVDTEKIRITSPTTGTTSVVQIMPTSSARVLTVLGWVGTEVNSGVAATSATVTNTLKNGYDLSSATTLDFNVDSMTKNIIFGTSGNASFANLYYASGSAITIGKTVQVDQWVFTISNGGQVNTNLKTADVAPGASNVVTYDNLVSAINTHIGTTLTATNTYNSGTLSGTVNIVSDNVGSAGNTIVFNTSDITAFYAYKDPTDNSLGYGNGSYINDLTKATVDNVIKEINRQAGGIYAYLNDGKIKLSSNVVGASSNIEIIGSNTAIGFLSGQIDNGQNAHDIITLTAKSTGTWGNRLSASVDTDNVISILENGLLVEKWTGSTISAAEDFIEDVININSIFVDATYLGAVNETIVAGLAGDLSGGDSGALVTETNVINAIKLYRNAEKLDLNLFAAPGFNSTNVLTELASLANIREDLLIIVDSPVGYTPQQIINWHNGTLGSGNTYKLDDKYLALYYPWVRMNDDFNGIVRLAPPSTLILEIMARNDKTASQWIAPAGVTNGFLSRALSVEYSASLEERDELYSITKKNNVNPIIEILGRGVVIWGQKTTQRALTSLNRVNVVRMVGYVRKKVKQIAMDLVFAPNDSTTWASFVARVTKLLTTIETGRGLSGFKVVMDGTNNPPETIAQGKLFGSIWLKPTIVAEQIELTYTIVGQDFKFN